MTSPTTKTPPTGPTGSASGGSSASRTPRLFTALLLLLALLLLASLSITVWRQLVPRSATSTTTNVCIYVLDSRGGTAIAQISGTCPPGRASAASALEGSASG